MKREMSGEQFLTKEILELYPSVEAFADEIGMSHDEIHQLLNNPMEHTPFDRVLVLCDALGFTLDDLRPYIEY